MPHKPKRRPPPPTDTFEQVNIQNAETHMSQFIKYYKGIDLVSEDEFKFLLESLLSELPVTFRISERIRSMNNIFDAKPGVLPEADVLKEFLKNVLLTKLSGVTIDDVPVDVTPVPWYPKQLLWKTNIDAKTYNTLKELEPIRTFIKEEEGHGTAFKQDITTILPVMAMDLQPHHKVLEMKSGAGLTTSLILEQMLANPRKMPEGVLVTNEREVQKPIYRYNRSTNSFFTHESLDKFPDLYLSEEHEAHSKLSYDRVILDAPCSGDGSMRSNPKLRISWNVTNGQKHHAQLKAMLRRGLELLELQGQLVYTTNSLNPIENEAVVAALLDEAPGVLELVDVSKRIGELHTRPGMTSWKVMSQGLVFYDTYESSPAWFQKENEKSLFPPENVALYNLDRCVRVLPHDNDTGSLFMAVIRKIGPLPWVKDDDEEAMEADTEKADEDKGASGDKEDEKKSPYIGPIRCDIGVSVAEIEWTTEITDEQLNTKSDSEHFTFDLPPMQISKHCIPGWLQKKMREESAKFTDMDPAVCDWNYFKTSMDLKKFDPQPLSVQYYQEGRKTVTFYCNPIVKQLIQSNPEVTKKTNGFPGGLAFLKNFNNGKCKMSQVIPFLPHMNKRLIEVPRIDMVEVFSNREVLFTKFTDKTKAVLESLENGQVVLMYMPKGKNADPKCFVYALRDKESAFLQDSRGDNLQRNHCLRLCGVDPQETETAVKEETMETE